VGEYNEASRSISTSIALLDTTTNQKVELSFVRAATDTDPTANNNVMLILPSMFANPSCTALPFELLAGAHGLNARPLLLNNRGTVASGFWEVAVVNHFGRESIEFYALNPAARTVASMGCVDFSTSGEYHNSVSFAPDGIKTTIMAPFCSCFLLVLVIRH
jgi:hypothetical protein